MTPIHSRYVTYINVAPRKGCSLWKIMYKYYHRHIRNLLPITVTVLNNTNLRKHLCCNIDVLQAHSDSYSSSYTAAYFFFSPSIASLAAVALAIFMFGPFPLYSPQSTFRVHWILPSSRVFAFLKKTKQNKKKHENLRDQEPIVWYPIGRQGHSDSVNACEMKETQARRRAWKSK